MHLACFLGSARIVRPTRLWLAVTNRRVLVLVGARYFFQDVRDEISSFHSFERPLHHVCFDRTLLVEMITVAVSACGLALYTYGVTLILGFLWWDRVYRSRGLALDGQVFPCTATEDVMKRVIAALAQSDTTSEGPSF